MQRLPNHVSESLSTSSERLAIASQLPLLHEPLDAQEDEPKRETLCVRGDGTNGQNDRSIPISRDPIGCLRRA